MIETMTTLNKIGTELTKYLDVDAMTDVTGFGVLGHGLETARGSGLRLALRIDALPVLSRAGALARDGFASGASGRNWESYGHEVILASALELWQRHIRSDHCVKHRQCVLPLQASEL